ncbi:DUF805 domain-containing protein [Ferrovibrio xuzhouensis]|uniref:Uncharacterized protein n=1 Tax=Ferrovibrio xuzhouensis TaxID=1576914 RepID=A0ABV7VI65_9PROT
MSQIIVIVVIIVAPFVAAWLGALMERSGISIARPAYLLRLVVLWVVVYGVSYYGGAHLFALGMGGWHPGTLAATVGLVVFQCVAFWYTGLLMARRLNDIGTPRYRWLAVLTGFPIIGLLVALVLGFLPPAGRGKPLAEVG